MIAALLISVLSAHASAESADTFAAAIATAPPTIGVTMLGPVAAKIYDDSDADVRLGLSAEFFTLRHGGATTAYDKSTAHSSVSFVRPQLGYRAHPRLLFNVQISFDQGGAERSDTVALRKGGATVRMAYADWMFNEAQDRGLRIGHQLIPVGVTNTTADSFTFFGVRRPELERVIIPADWHENGLLAWLDQNQVSLEGGVFSAPNARGLRGPTFLSGGLSQGQDSPSEDVVGVGRVNVRENGWLIGGSVAFGRTAQGNPAIPGGSLQLGEVHVDYQTRRWRAQAQVAQGRLADAGIISILNDTVLGAKVVGSSALGAFELLNQEERQLWAFARYTTYDLHAQVPLGFARDPHLDQRVTTIGLNYLPLPNVVVKFDAQRAVDAADLETTEVSLGGGFYF